MCSKGGTTKTINFPFGTNGKLMVLGVPILKHFRVVFIKHHLCYEPSIGGLSLVVAILGPFRCLVFHVPTRKACPKNCGISFKRQQK